MNENLNVRCHFPASWSSAADTTQKKTPIKLDQHKVKKQWLRASLSTLRTQPGPGPVAPVVLQPTQSTGTPIDVGAAASVKRTDPHKVKKRWLRASVATLHTLSQGPAPVVSATPVVTPVHVPSSSIPSNVDVATPVHPTHVTNPDLAAVSVVFL